jgi:transcriptional regulator with XRE-family HTH domain
VKELDQIVTTLKRRLKLHGMTYRDLAKALKVSEPSVKRVFASGRFTAERLIEVCEVLGITLAELTQEAAISGKQLHALSEDQERVLVSDEKLLLVTVCVLNHWALGDINHTYSLSEAQVIAKLVKLDRLRLLTLLPGNRIRLNVARDFDWLPRGPIRGYFHRNGMPDFLNSQFLGSEEVLAFSHGMLTETAIAKMQSEVRKLRQRFAEFHEESLSAPITKRRGTALLLGMREWELRAFTAMRRATR